MHMRYVCMCKHQWGGKGKVENGTIKPLTLLTISFIIQNDVSSVKKLWIFSSTLKKKTTNTFRTVKTPGNSFVAIIWNIQPHRKY